MTTAFRSIILLGLLLFRSSIALSDTNLALNKPTVQSSTLAGYPSAAASSAVDGNTDGDFFGGSVTHTNSDSNAWWQVDLGGSGIINSIVVWNRTNSCCVSRLSDYWVFASDTPFGPNDTLTTIQTRPATFSSHQTSPPNPSTTITTGGVRGRYVRVQLSGTNNLNLAEVMVMGATAFLGDLNLARNKSATQSSTLSGYPSAVAGSAVDGNIDGDFFGGSVTHTNSDSTAWWQVDLGGSGIINSIVVWNRTNSCCVSRLSDYWVFASDTPFGPNDTPTTLQTRPATFSSHQTSSPNPSTTITTGGVRGRYVRVQLSGTNNLNLAEVLVMGTTNLARNRSATQSTTLSGYPSAVAGSAVDGDTNGDFFGNSVTATTSQANAWWQVDLGGSAAISSIVVWNRTNSCCVSRLGDYWVFVSDEPFTSNDTPTSLQIRLGTFGSHQTTAPTPSTTINTGGVRGRYIRVQLAGTDELNLAEVQVFGRSGMDSTGDDITGTFLRLDEIADEKITGYLSEIAALHMDTVIVTNVLKRDGDGTTCIPWGFCWLSEDSSPRLKTLLSQASSKHISVILEVLPDGEDPTDAARAAATVAHYIGQGNYTIDTLKGWYLNREPSLFPGFYSLVGDPQDTYYQTLVTQIRGTDYGRLITISPYLPTYPKHPYTAPTQDPAQATPSDVASRADHFLASTGIDVLIYQDAVGARHRIDENESQLNPGSGAQVTLESTSGHSIRDYFAAISAEIGPQHLWVNHEAFNASSPSVTADNKSGSAGVLRLNRQIELVPASSVAKRVMFTQQHYMSEMNVTTQLESNRLFAAYKATHGISGRFITPVTCTSGCESPASRLIDGQVGDALDVTGREWVGILAQSEMVFDLGSLTNVDWVTIHTAQQNYVKGLLPTTGVAIDMKIETSPDKMIWTQRARRTFTTKSAVDYNEDHIPVSVAGTATEWAVGNTEPLGCTGVQYIRVTFNNSGPLYLSEMEIVGPN